MMMNEPIREIIRPFRCEVPVPPDIVQRIARARDRVIFSTAREPRFVLLGRLDYAELLDLARQTRRYLGGANLVDFREILGMIPLVDPETDCRISPLLEDQSLMITMPPETFR